MSISKDLLIDPSKNGAIVETTNVTILNEIDELLDMIDEKILALELPHYVKRQLSGKVYQMYCDIVSQVCPKSESYLP